MSIESRSGSADHGIKGVATHGGGYIKYNVYGSLFEVSRKYVPPIRPVGRGANGIVCGVSKCWSSRANGSYNESVSFLSQVEVLSSDTRELECLKKSSDTGSQNKSALLGSRDKISTQPEDNTGLLRCPMTLDGRHFEDLFGRSRLSLGKLISCAAVNSETREEVAIKKIGNAFDNRIDAKRTLREIKLLRHMDHENVIAIKDIIRPPLKEDFNDVYIVYELMDTDLHQIIRSNQSLTDDHCRVLRGLKYVHSANVLHRDLKPSNLLLNANCDLKIGDFGLARATSETDFMTEYVVTRWYRAPELLLNCSEYTAAIDIWSVGCILGEIMTRQPLFPGKDYVHQLRLITELIGSPDDSSLGFLRSENARRYVRQLPQYPKQNFSARFPNSSSGAVDLLEKMLIFDPHRRITVEEALCHPYLAPFYDINEEPICPRPFNFDFEQPLFTEENIKELIYRESVKFNTEPIH
ncbi:hypothetical protein Gotur_024718 [Gossypium turneri]